MYCRQRTDKLFPECSILSYNGYILQTSDCVGELYDQMMNEFIQNTSLELGIEGYLFATSRGGRLIRLH